MAQDELTPNVANATLYLDDFAAWCQETAAAIRAGQWDAIDREALAEEVDSLGKRESRALESRLEELVIHLLKWAYQPERRQTGHSWADTIMEQRRRLAALIRDNPRFRPRLATVLTDVYPSARKRARVAMAPGMPMIDLPGSREYQALSPLPQRSTPPTLPAMCPWSVKRVLDEDFWPGQAPLGLE